MSTTLDTLRHDFSGDVIEPGTPEYAQAARTMLTSGSPAVVLRPAGVEDVRAAVRFAAGSGLPLSVRGGGHAFAGFGTNDGGIVIDLARLAGVEIVDKDRHLVRIGGGATWGAVADALAPHGLAISSGDTRSVGVGGLTLSGGIGWKVRKHGLALDSLVAAEVVTADGRLVRADAGHDPDLWWALRGGGGNFGVVTAFEFSAHPTTDVFHGRITFPAAELPGVLRGWADHLRTAPEELTSIAAFANPFAGGAEAPVEIQLTFDGDDPRLAARAIDPIRALGTVLTDDVTLRPYGDVLVEGVAAPPGVRLVTRSAFTGGEQVPAVLRILAETGAVQGSPFVAVRSLGGRWRASPSRPPPSPTGRPS
ncbi:FAD linked oxidase-like protein [[Actinomadura] parvosata subsp. kistnae]|uniref:FAD-binding oxidoreductase n=1 Tax=[Actinomadura] parvosata TaxID=1955412 RepID=UPI000D2D08FA|nr:FAD linked oxidase-like protein [Actinomadura parvosata subsp. kistnae]